jgi:hypothetical protein
MPTSRSNVRHREQSGRHMLALSSSHFDPNVWSGRAVQEVFDPADAVLHQCIRPLLGARCAPGHHGYQRACDLISGQASTGPKGSPVFACAGKTDPPLSSHPLADLGGKLRLSYVIVSSSFCAVPLFVPGGLFLRPGLRAQTRRAQGAVKAGRRTGLAARASVARPCLDRPEHGATLKQVGTRSHWS